MGDTLLKLLIGAYVVIGGAYAWEGNWPKVLYFVGATILSIGILRMK